MKTMVQLSQRLLEKGWLPDPLIRLGMRQLLKGKLREERSLGIEEGQQKLMGFIQELKNSPIAIETRAANEQHYEVPTEFFQYVMGKHMKYSSGYWNKGVITIDESERDMLKITCERAELKDGQTVLELGCGWGSLSLYMAQQYPHSQITGVSNSRTQREFIMAQAAQRGLKNLKIITADMNSFVIDQTFDRVVSVEMFEHMRNYQKLMGKVRGFLNDGGKLFIHIFTHREFAYPYLASDESDWIGKYFFTGGIMPSDHLLFYFNEGFVTEGHWRVSGTHYQRTSEAWLKNMDSHKNEITPIFLKTYGREHVKWWNYWRIFFMACAELWGYDQGREWMVSHYRFRKG